MANFLMGGIESQFFKPDDPGLIFIPPSELNLLHKFESDGHLFSILPLSMRKSPEKALVILCT